MIQNHAIVLTGAPASGKTACIEALKADLQFSDFIFLEELARKLLENNPEYRFHSDEFHREIYKQQIEREDRIKNKSFITDRGTLDGFSFCPHLMDAIGTTIENEYERYTAVIQLGTSASLGEKYYRTDDIRNESIEKVMELEKATSKIWGKHPNYSFLPAEPDYEKKLLKLKKLMNLL
ncbi:MAG: AAA family ATPase [bacterium]